VLLAPSALHAERLRAEGLDAHCCLLKPLSVAALLEFVTKVDSLGVALVTEDAAA
jgi:BarA-like signal transduction histidine kinase